jgi:hypothetical protein
MTMDRDLLERVIAECERKGLDCRAVGELDAQSVRVFLGSPPLEYLSLDIGWEVSAMMTPLGDELLVMEDWQDAVPELLEIAAAMGEGSSTHETGSSLLWGPWQRLVVVTSHGRYGFGKRYRRHPHRRGASFREFHD